MLASADAQPLPGLNIHPERKPFPCVNAIACKQQRHTLAVGFSLIQ
jgi:hypothetical protein